MKSRGSNLETITKVGALGETPILFNAVARDDHSHVPNSLILRKTS